MFFLNLVTLACRARVCVCAYKCTSPCAFVCICVHGCILLQPCTDMATCSVLTFISQAHSSKSCTDRPVGVDFKWAGLLDALLLEGAVWVVPHYWLLPTSKIPLLPWLQGELPKSVSVSSGADGTVGIADVTLGEKIKNPPPPPHSSQSCSGAALRSLSPDACE